MNQLASLLRVTRQVGAMESLLVEDMGCVLGECMGHHLLGEGMGHHLPGEDM